MQIKVRKRPLFPRIKLANALLSFQNLSDSIFTLSTPKQCAILLFCNIKSKNVDALINSGLEY